MMRGESDEGAREVSVPLTQEVTSAILPGEYRCEGVTVYDIHTSRKTLLPRTLRFRVENHLVTMRGPGAS